jgi:uncharacterized protein (TIGR02145 family)
VLKVRRVYIDITVPGDYTSQLVVDPSGNVVLMGYLHPSDATGTIDSRSTAIAMALTTPVALWLSPEGKSRFINSLQAKASFDDLVSEVEAVVLSGRSLFDTTNVGLVERLATLVDDAAMRVIGTQGEPLINIIRAGRNVTFQNTGNAFTTVVGVYKDGAYQDQLILEGLQYAPASISVVIYGYAGLSGDPVQRSYSMLGDADFEFRMRTGFPGADDESVASEAAYYQNLGLFSYQVLTAFMPFLKTSTCAGTIVNNVASYVQTGVTIDGDANLVTILYGVLGAVAANTASLIDHCVAVALYPNYFEKLSKFFDMVNKPVSFIGAGINTSIFATQWSLADAFSDTCFTAMGSTVEPCESGCVGTVTDIDGNVYQTVQIGNQCWMAENLKVERYRDGSNIPTGLSNSAWSSTTSGAVAVYGNIAAFKDTYGLLYNWYAVADTRGLCPTGWHVPKDAEWTRLTNHLGGSSVAGGKMKTTGTLSAGTGLWFAPNTAATNSSGFSGLPGGNRGISSSFSSRGSSGYWWSSSESVTSKAYYQPLSYSAGFAYRHTNDKQGGFSVRCLRDE